MRYRLRTLLIVLALLPPVVALWYWQAQASMAAFRSKDLDYWSNRPLASPTPDVTVETIAFGMSAGTIFNLALAITAAVFVTVAALRRRTIPSPWEPRPIFRFTILGVFGLIAIAAVSFALVIRIAPGMPEQQITGGSYLFAFGAACFLAGILVSWLANSKSTPTED